MYPYFGLQPHHGLAPSLPAGDNEHPGLSIAWGTCGHVFHLDCIQRWLKTRSACPLCNKEWEFSKVSEISAGPESRCSYLILPTHPAHSHPFHPSIYLISQIEKILPGSAPTAD